MIFCVGLHGIVENGENCHGKVMEFYYQNSVGLVYLIELVLFGRDHVRELQTLLELFRAVQDCMQQEAQGL